MDAYRYRCRSRPRGFGDGLLNDFRLSMATINDDDDDDQAVDCPR